MLDFNTVGIKSTEDLQEALQIEHSAYEFEFQVEGMVQRWGAKSTIKMLSVALCGDDGDLRPIIQFKEQLIVDNLDDPWDSGRRVPIAERAVVG